MNKLINIVKNIIKGNIPNSVPQMTKDDVLSIIYAKYPILKNNLPDFFIVGIRGYYKDTMGVPKENDRRIYDDAIFLIGKTEFRSFNANTDPSLFRTNIATLIPGIWPVYKFDLHKGQYLAICQRAGVVTVSRDGKGLDTGYFGINIHRGSVNNTSSEGCQTIPPSQWKDFITMALVLAKKYKSVNYKKETYTYILL